VPGGIEETAIWSGATDRTISVRPDGGADGRGPVAGSVAGAGWAGGGAAGAGTGAGTCPKLIVTVPASRTRWSTGAAAAVDPRGGALALGVGGAGARAGIAGRGTGAGETAGLAPVSGPAVGRARGCERRGDFAVAAGTLPGCPRRAASTAELAAGEADGTPDAVPGADVGGWAAAGESPIQQSSKATTELDGQADRPIIPFPSPSGSRGAMAIWLFRMTLFSGFIGRSGL
jgi:hypothetical protein